MNNPKTVRAASPPAVAINQRGTRLLVSAILKSPFEKVSYVKEY